MRATVITRKIDEVGRIVVPKELRDKLDLKYKDAVDIYVEEDRIILRKYEPSCVFCGEASNVIQFKGKNVCPNCAKELSGTAK